MTLDIKMFTIIHVAISLLAIASGYIVVFGLISAKRLDGWTAFFLATTILTSVTGFGFPIVGVTPGIVLGVISLVVLAIALYARYARHLMQGPGALSLSYRCARPVSKFLRLDRTVFSEGAGAQDAGSDAIRIALCDHPAGCEGRFIGLGFLATTGFRERTVNAA